MAKQKHPKIFQTTDKKKTKTADGFDNFLSRVGLRNDNVLSAGIYLFNLMTRNRVQLEAAYRGSWIVGQVIDTVAEDMTKAGIDITTNEGDEDIKDLQANLSRLRIWQSICSKTKWERLYGGAIAVLQIEGQDLATPLDIDTITQGQFKGLVVFDRWQLNPVLQPLIQQGPQMGLPEFYQITNNPTQTLSASPTATGQQTVHHSRCIRGVGIELPYFQAITEMLWGESILERLWDRLISFDTATLSCANLIERANNRTVGIEGFRQIIAAGGQAQKALERQFEMMRTFQTNEGLTLLDKNDSFATTSYSFAGLSDVMLQFGQQLAGASGIPLVRLFGQSPAGLNSTGDSDLRTYYDNINSQQEAKLRDGVDKILKIMWISTFGRPAPKDMEFTFVPLWQMSALDKATIGKTNAETIIGALDAGLVDRATGMKELRQSSGDTGLFSNITDEAIAEAEEEDPLPLPGEPSEEEPKEVVPAMDRVTDAGNFKESDHPRKNDGKFGQGGSESNGSLGEKISEASKKMKAAKRAALQARSRADTAPDRADENPKSLADANEKTRIYNEAAKEYNALLNKRDGNLDAKPKKRFKLFGR